MSQYSPRPRRTGLPLAAMAAGLVLLSAAIVLGLRSHTPEPPSTPDAPAGASRVSLAEARAAYDNGEAVFLDVRSADSYAAAHIPGALSIPLAELPNRIGELDPGSWIITYCT